MAEPFTESQITECLMALIAWAGNAAAAARAMKAEGKRCPTGQTLTEWSRGAHADRYEQLRTKYAEQLESQLAHEYRDVARQAVEVQRKALDRALERLDSKEDSDPARTAANAATVADKMTGKLLALTGRPTSIREDRNLHEIMRSLAAKGILKLPDQPPEIEAEASA